MSVEPRPAVASLVGYQWEESSSAIAARLGIDVSAVVRFDTNTVPWQLPVPVSGDGLRLNEYPDASYRELTEAIAAHVDRPAESIVVGAGGDELISLLAQAYLDADRTTAIADPTYSLFEIGSRIAGATVDAVPCTEGYALDRPRFLEAASRAHVTWLANPNNPTGELLPQDYVRDVAAAAAGLVVVDEAYAEFVGGSALEGLDAAPNVVVLRTLSKAFGLAGLRIGYVVAGPDVVATLDKVRPVSSISAVSARAGAAALGQAPRMRELVRGLVAERHRLAAALAAGGRPVIEGEANFVLARLDPAALDRAQRRGLVLRTYGGGHRLDGWSRVTVRAPEENARLLDAVNAAGG
jgi:histidinol-phosphate aminotransferase